jgi:hypothetical protein
MRPVVIASEAKQSLPQKPPWIEIASLRSR